MNYENSTIQTIPFNYILAFLLLVFLTVEVWLKRKKAWAIPAVVTYGTVGMWYFIEIIYTPENYLSFPSDIVELAFFQVIIFLATFRLLVTYFVKKLTPKTFSTLPHISLIALKADRLLYILALIWLLLLLAGLSQVNWNIMEAMLPIHGRASYTHLFARPQIGGLFDFIISSLSYTYNLICSFFGVMFFFQKRINAKILNLALMIISWPMFMFLGTRNTFLATVVPFFLTYLIVSKQKLLIRILFTCLGFIFINYVMTIMIAFRNVGFEHYLSQVWETGQIVVPKNKHEGLNMAQELFYINNYIKQGVISLHYGYDYLVEALNWVPRALWTNKPFIGLDYAQLRAPGHGGVGIHATVSRGLIGGGVMNFGPIIGPVAPAFLMAVWSGILARFWKQRDSILRFALFLVGLGTTPNLGRDFTLLVLWPIIFGYFIVLYLEDIERKKSKRLKNYYSGISEN